MTEKKLLEKLTGVNNPRFITPREDAIIKECLTIINQLEKAISVTRCSTQLNHEDFTIGEKVWMTTNKIVEIDTFCEDGTILVEDVDKCYKVHKQELRKVV